ncbi:chemotaxis histidine kinase [Methanocella arvoryzae MRE50]|uniref:Chemotaxis protein CheA n=2 Tax=Methanocella TaxID=570266 RepID=Q0W7Z2_METAR|nr:chemotaxis histidine kinase [Methanocella arvoryzae MRE50]
MSAYRDMFVSEAREHLQNLNSSLLALEKCPTDADVIQEIFRSAHTLKGMSASMGFKEMETLCHRTENLFDRIRNGQLVADTRVVTVLFKSLDTLEAMVDAIEAGESGSLDVAALVKEIESMDVNSACSGPQPQVQAHEAQPSGAAHAAADTPEVQSMAIPAGAAAGSKEFEVVVTVEKSCEFKGIRAFLVIQQLSEIGKVASTVPDIKDIEDERFGQEFTVLLQSDRTAGEIEKKARNVAEIGAAKVTEIVRKEAAGGPARPAGKEGTKVIHSVRIDIDRLDIIMNLVGELVISRGRLFEICGKQGIHELNETLGMVDRSITDLQNEVMRIRMLPVDHVFNRFPRIVRDISKKEGKEIEFTIEGQDTELDRTVLDEISDPLNHLIRNAVDHGIEKPEDRIAQGKPATGQIQLIARRERSNVIIEIIDDGKGIDVDRVKRKAIDKGLITQAQADAMSEEEGVMLIFKPGLSTADRVTEVSGRGVGMDIVKTKIESLGGTVKIETHLGKGTKTILKLPPTIAIVQALLVNVGAEKYAISITNVVETEYVKDKDIKTINGNEVIVIRDTILPLYRLYKFFDVEVDSSLKRHTAVVVEKGEEKVALLVDSIESQQEIFVKPLGGLLQNVKGLEGVTIMGNGRVVPILDVATITEVKK